MIKEGGRSFFFSCSLFRRYSLKQEQKITYSTFPPYAMPSCGLGDVGYHDAAGRSDFFSASFLHTHSSHLLPDLGHFLPLFLKLVIFVYWKCQCRHVIAFSIQGHLCCSGISSSRVNVAFRSQKGFSSVSNAYYYRMQCATFN